MCDPYLMTAPQNAGGSTTELGMLLFRGGTLAWLEDVSSKAPAISYPFPEKPHISYLLTSGKNTVCTWSAGWECQK